MFTGIWRLAVRAVGRRSLGRALGFMLGRVWRRGVALETLICKINLLKMLLRLPPKGEVISKPIRMPDLDEIPVGTLDV
jgi:hypothetical protein